MNSVNPNLLKYIRSICIIIWLLFALSDATFVSADSNFSNHGTFLKDLDTFSFKLGAFNGDNEGQSGQNREKFGSNFIADLGTIRLPDCRTKKLRLGYGQVESRSQEVVKFRSGLVRFGHSCV